MKKFYTLIFFIIISGLFYSVSTLTGGCAQIGMPMGGPRDTLPPVLLESTPPNHSVNFNANLITLTFDEYIQLDNPIQNVLVSPLPKKNPFIDFRLKTVTVKLYDTLQPDKTYSLRFGNTIKDLNEGNPYKDFDYVFSTGSFIDTLTINGKIRIAETGEIDSTLTVTLYPQLDDSTVYKEKPEYIAKLNKEGDFSFKYLSPGSYHIFAIKDESGRYTYNNPQQLFAFADSTINPGPGNTVNISLFAYEQEKQETKPEAPSKDTVLKYSNNLSNNTLDLLQSLTLNFNQPLKSVDSNKIMLTDTLYKSSGTIHFKIDSTGRELSVNYNWKGGENYRLIIPAGSLSDTLGRTLPESDTLIFKTKNESEYGSLKLNFTHLENFRNPVLILKPNQGKQELFPLPSATFEKRLILPGSYNILILEDLNENGQWDPGNYEKRLQPEIVHKFDNPITVRANWENEMNIDLDKSQ